MKKKKKGENSTAKQAWLIWVDNLGTFYNERLFVLLINFAVTYQCQSFKDHSHVAIIFWIINKKL